MAPPQGLTEISVQSQHENGWGLCRVQSSTEQCRTPTWTRGHLQQHVVSRGHGGGCCSCPGWTSCSWGDVVVVPLVSEQLVVDVVVDGEQQLRELPVLHAAEQLHHPPLHLQAGGAQLLQQLLVLGVLLPSS